MSNANDTKELDNQKEPKEWVVIVMDRRLNIANVYGPWTKAQAWTYHGLQEYVIKKLNSEYVCSLCGQNSSDSKYYCKVHETCHCNDPCDDYDSGECKCDPKCK